MGIKLQMLSFFVVNSGIALLTVAVISGNWASRENDRIHIYEGLWKKCVHHKRSWPTVPRCKTILEDEQNNHGKFPSFIAMETYAVCFDKSHTFVYISIHQRFRNET